MRKLICWLSLTGIISLGFCQKSSEFWSPSDTLHSKRTRWVTSFSLGSYGLGMLGLGSLWYSQEDLGGFHFFDDSHQWQQMDKVGHALSGFQLTRGLIHLYDWAGQPKARRIAWSAGIAWVMVGSVEVFDGFGESWGFSWPDIAANSLGVGLAVLNHALWEEDRIQLKLGYQRSPYAADPANERLFGSSLAEWWLKDYNGQTYWLTARVHSFLPEGSFKDRYPRWLNLAVGYGAEGMIGGYDDPNEAWRWREYRQLYLSLDLDLSQIKTRSPFLNALFTTFSVVRIPFPSLAWDQQGFRFIPLH